MTSDISQIIRNFADESKGILHDNVIEEYLFGSYATKTQTSVSDIDILIVVKDFKPDMQSQLSELAFEYALKYDVCISPILKDIKIWEKNKYFHTLFWQEVERYGIKL